MLEYDVIFIEYIDDGNLGLQAWTEVNGTFNMVNMLYYNVR